jgi:hypothetical protein
MRTGLTCVIIPHVSQVISSTVVRFTNWKSISVEQWDKRWLIRTGSRVVGQIHVAIVTVMFLGAVNRWVEGGGHTLTGIFRHDVRRAQNKRRQ